jgi:hypothetical protein
MKSDASRRNFLTAGLALPVAGMAAVSSPQKAAAPAPLKAPAAIGLKYKVLGRTGLKVTTVGFGTMVTSDGSVIEKAVDLGITYFDTARGYQGGNCERMVGAALKGKRQNLILSSKSPKEDKEGALADLETSLKTIGTDYLDIWYLHAKSRGSQITDGRLEAQEIAKKKGMIRFAGVSTHGGFEDVIPAAIKCGKMDVILSQYNFTMGDKIDGLLADAKKANIGVVAMKVMAGGFRRNKPGDKQAEILKRDGAMTAALKWALRNANVDTTIPSITDMDQLDENMRCMSESFSGKDEQTLKAQLDFIRPLYCRACGSCSGVCPNGLPVSDMVRFAMYAEGYGEFALGRENFLTLSQEVRDVRCGNCTECAIKCPNGVNVAQRVGRAQELFA